MKASHIRATATVYLNLRFFGMYGSALYTESVWISAACAKKRQKEISTLGVCFFHVAIDFRAPHAGITLIAIYFNGVLWGKMVGN